MSDEFRQRLDAVEDWSKRIVPLIREAVAKANSQIAEKKMCLSPSSPELRSSRVTPTEMQDFPGIRIIARPESQGSVSQRRSPARRLAGKRNTPEEAQAHPTIKIGRVANGKIKVEGAHCTLSPQGPFTPEQFDQERIELVISDFVEAVLPAS